MTSDKEDFPWVRDYLKERRKLLVGRRMRPVRNARIKWTVTTLRDAAKIFDNVKSRLPLPTPERPNNDRELTTKDLKLAAEKLGTLLTPGRDIDAGIAATVHMLEMIYRASTGRPRYPNIGKLLRIANYSDVLLRQLPK